jgi:hypothetical protein
MKSYRAIICVGVEFVSSVSEIISASIIKVNVTSTLSERGELGTV